VFQTLFVFSSLFADWVIGLLYGYFWKGEMKAQAYNAEVMDFWRNNRRHKTCGNGEEEREGCCIKGATASDYIHKRAE
jgi:hypothetical protein